MLVRLARGECIALLLGSMLRNCFQEQLQYVRRCFRGAPQRIVVEMCIARGSRGLSVAKQSANDR